MSFTELLTNDRNLLVVLTGLIGWFLFSDLLEQYFVEPYDTGEKFIIMLGIVFLLWVLNVNSSGDS